MKRFWNCVNAMLEKHGDDFAYGYLEIVAHGITYRSIEDMDHGNTTWISWEPYKIIGHFSALTDPDATIKWIKHERAQ